MVISRQVFPIIGLPVVLEAPLNFSASSILIIRREGEVNAVY